MPNDLYSDNPGDTETKETSTPDTSSPPEREDADEGETFLVSKSALGREPKPGDVCEFKCVRVYEDEAEFEYQGHDKSESKNEDMDKAYSDMDMMSEEGGMSRGSM